VFLGYTDDYKDIENQKISFNEEQARREIGNIIQDYDLVLTHDKDGDYGHIHHRLVHSAAAQHHNVVTFAPPGQGTVTYTVPSDTYSIDELPLHGEIVRGFHPITHQNDYKELK
jgi:hypothetical protein